MVGAIVPWNNPILLMGAKVAASLAAGNAIVVKPASTTPLSTLKSMELFKESWTVQRTAQCRYGIRRDSR